MNDEPQDDPQLRKVLQAWKVAETLPPRFEDRVWRRLSLEPTSGPTTLWTVLLDRVTRAFARPSLAASYLAVLIAAGVAAGYWHARLDNAHVARQLGSRYVRLLDSYETSSR
jgi:hypothetical protein